MKYYNLLDDLEIPNRIHVGEVTIPSGLEVRNFDAREVNDLDVCHGQVTQKGLFLDFFMTSFGIPIFSERVSAILRPSIGADVDFVRIKLDESILNYYLLKTHEQVDCLDEVNTKAHTKWQESDGRPDKTGQYRMVYGLKINSASISKKSHVFRIKKWNVALIVSELVKEAMENAQSLGAKFIQVA